ncbi:hypothetical protein PRIPAC_94191 [Pristionchus pacificus]|uniref:Chromo domain-containing protein n=1 Tax=Pristionchus pacificus TaxID=54126 RepID=A0A454XX51_PRIPA|nr:hypothetical protein PRIPAC_94191 [Pristionchus pacificus]|eukprot:PDM68205.1 hypothetical protein PRIPAC_46249 [Pristionchus pacificus]
MAPSPKCKCYCTNCAADSTPFADRPVSPGEEGKISQLTEIEEIIDFRHPNAAKMKSACDVPEGEGFFFVKWKGFNQKDWIKGDCVFDKGLTAIRKYFLKIEEKRKEQEKVYLDKLTHISSLYDIYSAGIVCEHLNDYKVKIGGLSDDFLFELAHPMWGLNITKQFEIVREKGELFVWVNHLQVRSVFRTDVMEWEKKQHTRPTQEEIDAMDWIDFGRYLVRKDQGFYYGSEGVNSSSEEGSCEAGEV